MIHLWDGASHAEIHRDGAELRSWQVADVPLIWTPDPAVWGETAPILFPVVGWTRGARVLVEGQSYPLGLHGFARTLPFAVLEQWPAHVRLGLRSSPETRDLYPFDWSLEIEYVLAGPSLETILTIRNTGERPMPYACGLHPGFRWPFAGGEMDEYRIVFAEREATSVPVISADGLFTHQTRRIPLDGRHLPLSPALFANEALCFLDARSTSLRFAHASGAALDVALTDFPHIALWSRPAGRFLSIEAWTGHGDRVDGDGHLFSKPSMRHLPAGATASHAAKFSYAPAHLLFR